MLQLVEIIGDFNSIVYGSFQAFDGLFALDMFQLLVCFYHGITKL
jgi:hypothetical protein